MDGIEESHATETEITEAAVAPRAEASIVAAVAAIATSHEGGRDRAHVSAIIDRIDTMTIEMVAAGDMNRTDTETRTDMRAAAGTEIGIATETAIVTEEANIEADTENETLSIAWRPSCLLAHLLTSFLLILT